MQNVIYLNSKLYAGRIYNNECYEPINHSFMAVTLTLYWMTLSLIYGITLLRRPVIKLYEYKAQDIFTVFTEDSKYHVALINIDFLMEY